MECRLKESMRLFATVPNIERLLAEDVDLGGYKVPAGTTVAVNIFAVHRNEELFPDPLSYKPERFKADQSTGRHPYAFISFIAGPRICIGESYS